MLIPLSNLMKNKCNITFFKMKDESQLNLLYISPLCSKRFVSELFQKTGKDPGFAVQKFSRLLVKGIVENDSKITALSIRPISRQLSSKVFWGTKKETEDGMLYHYVPFLNLNYMRHVCLFFYCFFYVLFWGIGKREQKAIICDVLSISACTGSLLAAKIIGVQSVGVMTDMPGLMMCSSKDSLATKLNKSYISSFSSYVFLTEQMNGVINKKNRPYIVMEGLVDATSYNIQSSAEKTSSRTVLYAGGLHERYGLKMLVNGFVMANIPNAQLVIYGGGPYVDELKRVCAEHSNVVYKGLADNSVVFAEEQKATLLVNPRPTTEEFTQYSFPSKNMEYMVSGTPVLITRLPGMPTEYNNYVYLFDEETENGYAKCLKEVLSKGEEELKSKGHSARQWVLENKNNVVQAGRIVKLIKEVVNQE